MSANWQPLIAFTVSGISEDGIKSLESAVERVRANPGTNLTLMTVEDGVVIGGDEESFLEEVRKQAVASDGAERPLLLEPMMEVEFLASTEDMPAITAEIRARRGRIVSNYEVFLAREVVALVPLAELLNASARGKPDWKMRFTGYEVFAGRDDTDGEIGIAVPKWPRGPNPRTDRASERP
jgi:translation elongation factor EF-G